MLSRIISNNHSTFSKTENLARNCRKFSWLFMAITFWNPGQLLGMPQKEGEKKAPAKTVQDDDEIGLDELAGVVLDSEGEPLPDVLVDAWSWYPGNETRTDKQGRFRLKMGDASNNIEVQCWRRRTGGIRTCERLFTSKNGAMVVSGCVAQTPAEAYRAQPISTQFR